MKTFWQEPTVIGDCIISGEEPWPVGDENAGVAERELPRDTETRMEHVYIDSGEDSSGWHVLPSMFAASVSS